MAQIRTSLEHQWEYAQRHKLFEKEKRSILPVFEQTPAEVYSQATLESRKLFNLYSQVMREIDNLFCFLRLDINKHGLLHAKHTPAHQVEDFLVWRFMYRFPMFVIALESERGCFVGFKKTVKKYSSKLEKIIEIIEREFPVHDSLAHIEQFDQSLWHSFLDGQTIKERINPSLFKKNIPKKYHHIKTFTYELQLHKQNKNLEEFMIEKE